MPKVREVTTKGGETRYQFIVDITLRGQRQQIVRRYKTREEAEERLAAHLKAIEEWRKPTGEIYVTDLFLDDRCHPMCVFALGTEKDECNCACGGRFHGKLTELRCSWEFLDAAPVRAIEKSARPRSRPITPELRQRVLNLREEALAHPYYRYKPATYIRERFAEDGISVSQAQVNSWIHHARKTGDLPPVDARRTFPLHHALDGEKAGNYDRH